MTSMPNAPLTPLMRQYFDIKQQYPDTLLLFQVGDFYELFFDDAKQAAAFLGIALTKRGKINGDPIPLCGVPVHVLDYYVAKLVRGGFKVALCDQLEEAVPGKVVERGVTQVLTPGTLTDAKLLDEKSASYLLSFFPVQDSWGLLFGELMTAQLYATVVPAASHKILESELSRFFPDEILLPQIASAKPFQTYFKQLGYFTTLEHRDENHDEQQAQADAWINKQFQQDAREQLGHQESLRLALTTFYSYVSRNQRAALDQFKTLHVYKPEDFLLLDSATQRNLELVKNTQDGGRQNTLFSLMDKAMTPMGSRMIKKWILRPLVKREAIEQRHAVVGELVDNVAVKQHLEELLSSMGDIERIVGRIALHKAVLADYLALMQALALVPQIKHCLLSCKHHVLLQVILAHLADFQNLHALLLAALNDDTTLEYVIKKGFDQHLDDLRELAFGSNQKILDLEALEQQKSGINGLKIRYNQVHGYYIELTKTQAKEVPDYFIRQQTLVGRERYTTHELRSLQDAVLRAQHEVSQTEKQVFERVKQEVITHITALRKAAQGIAHVDALLGFGRCAYEYGYVRPQFNTERVIDIHDGRHPVVETTLCGSFIPNSTLLSDNVSLWIITGPNMGGKSTYLRQVALICIMAQCGAFVPARAANLALLDRVFTRIGAGDNVAGGKSTFLVEMEETATICSQATERSLVILDEVGRGTSTFDGLAIAQSVVEYMHTKVKARCLFATHYHELTLLEAQHQGIQSYYAASKKTDNGIIFLHKIMRGVADGSFGLEVAKLAELPPAIIARAGTILTTLQQGNHGASYQVVPAVSSEKATVFQLEQTIKALQQELANKNRALQLLQTVDFDDLSPKKAFDLLWKLKEV